MTQLLISVKNSEESQLAKYAGVDLIDLKDPTVGALGALDIDTVRQIVKEVNGSTLVSATVGEGHATIEELTDDIALYASLGVDIVKIAMSELFQQADFFTKIMQLTSRGIKIVIVFFAEQALDFGLIPLLQTSGCYGAMLDTQLKQSSLLTVQPIKTLSSFVSVCAENELVSGLAGSVNKQHIEELKDLNPDFIGMRGGVCRQHDRTSALVYAQITEVKALLLNCNIASG